MAYKVTKPRRSASSKPSSIKKLRSAVRASPLRRNAAPTASAPTDDASAAADDLFGERLTDLGIVPALPHAAPRRDVQGLLAHARATALDPLPQPGAAGLTEARLAAIRDFRALLPPVTNTKHIHALLAKPTHVEREIGRLVREGVVRRVAVPGRGAGAAGLGEGVALTADWVAAAREAPLADALKEKYIAVLESTERISARTWAPFSDDEITALMRAGFLVIASPPQTGIATSASGAAPSARESGALGSALSLHSVAAASASNQSAVPSPAARVAAAASSIGPARGAQLQPTLPRVGALLRLVEAARAHLLGLLARSKHGEAPAYLLRERWDGGVSARAAYGLQKDPFAGALPGRTRKWREFYGMGFDWVLAECVGGGLVEVFDTGTVGLGVRKL